MTQLTTHVLDTAQGIPAERVQCTLFRISGDQREKLATRWTNSSGRTDSPLLSGEQFLVGTYELVFDIGFYFHHQPVDVSHPAFLDLITLRFTVADASQHYHVPLLVSPWSYSTYRGS